MLLIKNGTVHTGDGTVLTNCDVLTDEGKLKRIGRGIEVPELKNTVDTETIEIIDASGCHVMPGFIDPTNSTGAQDITYSYKDTDESSSPISAQSDVKYSFNPDEVMMEKLYETGITTIGVVPGNANVIGGKAAAYKTYGQNTCKMQMREFTALKGSVTTDVKETYGARNQCPKTKMGIFALLEKWLRGQSDDSDADVVERVKAGEVPLLMQAETKAEIQALIEIISRYDIRLIISGAYQAHKCMESIRKVKASVVVGEQIYLSKNVYNDIDLYRLTEILEWGDLSFSLSGPYGPAGKVKYLWNAVRFVQAGIESETVLKMMTQCPARMLGIDSSAGTLSEGKDADIAIFTNDPVKYYDARCIRTIMQGKTIYREGGDR